MKNLPWIMLSVLITLPLAAHAEIYKWKDKDGVMRYSDTPPPSNIEQLPVAGNPKSRAAPPPQLPAGGDAPVAPAPGVQEANKKSEADLRSDEVKRTNESIQRQEKAETERKNAEQKAAELKAKEQSCITAKGNMQNYQQGGRIYKMNEKGEREYESNEDIARGLEEAKKEVELYCDS